MNIINIIIILTCWTNSIINILFQRLFLKSNQESLQALRAGDALVDLCLSLPSIKRAKGKVEDALAGKPFCIPTNHAEATTLRNT